MGYRIDTTTVMPIEIPTVSEDGEGVMTPEMLAELESAVAVDNIDIYVSPSGSDSNDGSVTSPVATVARARELKAFLWNGSCNINFEAGTYTLPRVLSFIGGPSGSAASPETWRCAFADQLGSLAVDASSTTQQIIANAAIAGMRSGAAASITAVAGTANTQGRTMTVTGMSGLTSADVGKNFFFGLATNQGNNGVFKMASFISSSSGTFYNSQAAVEATGLIYWQDSFRGASLRFTKPGRITCVAVASLVNNDNFTITRNGCPTVYEYKVNGAFVPVTGRVTIDVSALADP